MTDGILAFSAYTLAYTLPRLRDPTKQRLGVYVWTGISVVMLGVLMNLFKIKQGACEFGSSRPKAAGLTHVHLFCYQTHSSCSDDNASASFDAVSAVLSCPREKTGESGRCSTSLLSSSSQSGYMSRWTLQ